jgi:Fe-S-cluster containining protein
MSDIDQIIPEGFCLTCKGCCRFAREKSSWVVHLASDEQQALGIQDITLPAPVDPATGSCVCSYFDKSNQKCAVYYKRPFECRLYPFVINRQGSDVFLSLDMNCPYAHSNYETQAMRDYIQHLTATCNSSVFAQYLKENPWLIQQYPGVLNIAPISL